MRFGLRTIHKRLHKTIASRVGEVSRSELPALRETSTYLEYGEPERIRLPDPDAIQPTNLRWVETNLSYWESDWPRPFVCELEDVHLLGHLYLAVLGDGRIVGETTRTVAKEVLWPKSGLQTLLDLRSLRRGDTAELRGERYLPLFHVSEDSYYHWINDVLPVLEGARAFQQQHGGDIRYLIRRPLRTWQAESLRLLGVEPDQVELWRGRCARVRRLLVVAVRTDGWTALPSIASARWLRDELLHAVPPERGPESVYVVRTGRRPIRNAADVHAEMKNHGIECIDCARMSVREQINTFRGARLIVGAHGAGLTNMIFGTDTQVLELFGYWKSLCYATLAQGLGHTYRGLDFLPRVGYYGGRRGIRRGFTADMAQLSASLDELRRRRSRGATVGSAASTSA